MSALGVLGHILPAEALREGGSRVAGAEPEATVTPTSEGQIVEVLHAAASGGFGVIPVGGGTHLGAEAPRQPFIVLSTLALAGVGDYEPADLTLSVGAGTTLHELESATSPHGQWLPFDPPAAPRRTLGGLAATGTRSPLCASYGAPRDHILGLTLVTGDGRVLRLGGRVMKNVAGFDLVRLAVGSRGTLGVVVSVNVRLFPRPARDVALVLRGDSAEDLVPAARAVATAPVLPASALLSTNLSREGRTGASARLTVRLQGAPETVEADARRFREHVSEDFQLLEEPESAALFSELRDHPAEDGVLLRLTALPDRLAGVLAAAAAMGEEVSLVADVLAGIVRAATGDMSPGGLAAVRETVAGIGGSCTLERGPAELAAAGRGTSANPGAEALAGRLARKFDPEGILWPREDGP